MSIEQDSLEVVVPEQLAAVSAEFVTFLKKYYEWMGQDGNPSEQIANSIVERNLWTATQDYLDYLYKEFGYAWIENPEADRANIIARLSDIYKTRGSIDSIKILFRALFGEEVEVKLPKEFILKPSTGLWAQEYSVICDLVNGDPNDVIGRFSTVTTQFPGQPIQKFDVEIKSINPRGPGVYELYISRFFAGFFFDGSTVEFENTKFNVRESLSNIIATTVPGATFNAGDAYSIQHFKRNQTWDYINDELTGATQTKYQGLFEKYFTTRTFNRWYRDITRINVEKQEEVQQYSFTDGTIVEEVTRDRLTKTIVQRGNSLLTTYKATDGTTKQEQKVIPDGDFIVAPDITINWDDLIIQMIQYVEGIGSPALASFLEEEEDLIEYVDGLPVVVGTYKRGDTNQDGVIDETDIELLIRRVMGKTVQAQYHQWIDQKLGTEIRSRQIGAALEVGEGTGAWYRVTSVGQGGTIESGLIFSFGYGYPTVYTAILVPANGLIDDHAEVVFSSKLVAVSAAEYRDRKGFISDINKIFDNYYYQEFSYVVESSLDNETVENVIQRTVHPAGQKLFSERVIIVNMEYPGIGLSSAHHVGFPSVVSNLFTALQMERNTVSDRNEPGFDRFWNYVEKSLTEANGYPDPIEVDDPLWKHYTEKMISAGNGYNEGTELTDYEWKDVAKNLYSPDYPDGIEVGQIYYNWMNKYREDGLEFQEDVWYTQPNKYREDAIEVGQIYSNWPNKFQGGLDNTLEFQSDVWYNSVEKTIIYDFGNTGSSNPYFEEFDGDWPDANDYMFNQFDYVFDTPGRINGLDISDTLGMEFIKAPFYSGVELTTIYQNHINKSRAEELELTETLYRNEPHKYRTENIELVDTLYYNHPYKGLGESLTLTEYIDKVIGRDVFSYNTQVSDTFSTGVEKAPFQDDTEISDASYQDPNKYREDGTEVSDVYAGHTEKSLTSANGYPDPIELTDVYEWSFDKDRSDSTEVDDGWFNDVWKSRSDSIEVGQTYYNHLNKYKTDSEADNIEISTVFDVSYVKSLAESLEIAETFSSSYYKYKTDNLEVSQAYSWSFEKPFVDNVEVSGVVAKATEKYTDTDSLELSESGTVAQLRDYTVLSDTVWDTNYVIYGDDDPYTF